MIWWRCKNFGIKTRPRPKSSKPKYIPKTKMIIIDGKRHHTEEAKNNIRLAKLGKKRTPFSKETKRNMSLGQVGKKMFSTRGKKHHAFNNWSSREPYGKDFSPKLKEYIRNKYHYRCQQCFRHQDELTKKLFIHHIDYNKKNNSSTNLIPLCGNCHSQTLFDRQDWIDYFQSKVVIWIYFEVLEHLRKQKQQDPTRWFTIKEIEISLQREHDFSHKRLLRALARLREQHKVMRSKVPMDPEIKSSFRPNGLNGGGLFVYKSIEDNEVLRIW